MTQSPPGRRHWLLAPFHALAAIWRFLSRATGTLAKFAFGVLLVVVALFSLGNFVVSTPQVEAYRRLHPGSAVCKEGLEKGWPILANFDPARMNLEDDDGWVDPSNDEIKAIATDTSFATKLQCALQRHIVPSAKGPQNALTYYLDFIEFKEDGQPYPLVTIDGDGHDMPPPSSMLEPPNQPRMINQLDALKAHLAQGSNYVIVFIHGWRHNASIGDGNVADLRHYAAHVARFLKRRCELEKLYCDTRVTAVYIGWRGARVDEAALKRNLGAFGNTLGGLAAGATLFDRKPVSEQVAPGAISALRAVERVLSSKMANGQDKPNTPVNRMIVFGHSLGGNMLATGLEDDLLKLVREHKAGQHVPPVLGDLVVLINPAAEAAKWTAIQREVWGRIPFHVDENMSIDDVAQGHMFFPVDQRPVIISVTSALAFPPGGLRTGDCEWFNLASNQKKTFLQKVAKGEGSVDYDWATQDLFPTFKFDFRPLSLRLERLEASMQGQPHAPGQGCDPWKQPTFWTWLETRPVHWLSQGLANFPFQNTDQELSHTIGHLDPPRPADGLLTEKMYSSELPFGTTHELFGLQKHGLEKHNPYASLADAPIDCEPANFWLARAREHEKPFGTFWDSAYLSPAAPNAIGAGPPAAQFLHGAYLSGMAAITRANDPFWNMRAFDNALSRHDGYRLTSFICAMNQLVMDDIVGQPPAAPPKPETTSASAQSAPQSGP